MVVFFLFFFLMSLLFLGAKNPGKREKIRSDEKKLQ